MMEMTEERVSELKDQKKLSHWTWKRFIFNEQSLRDKCDHNELLTAKREIT